MTTSAGGIKSKSFRRLRISLRHRWIAGESILNSFHFNQYRFVWSLSLCVFCLDLTCALAHALTDREIRREIRFPNGQNSNRIRRHKFVLSSSSLVQRWLNSTLSLRTRTTQQRDSLSLSSSFSPTRARKLRFVRALFALKCEGQKVLVPLLKRKDAKHYYLGCM